MEEHQHNETLIKNVLVRAFPNYTIENYSVTSGSLDGDGYAGILYSIKVDLKPKTNSSELLLQKNLILKTSSGNIKREIVESLFKREAGFYTELIPEFEKFQKSRIENGVGDPNNYIDLAFVPCYDVFLKNEDNTDTFPWDYILMQDMREGKDSVADEEGYKMACKIEGLDYEHCKLVLIELAKYHAVSYAYMQSFSENKNIFKRFTFLKEFAFTIPSEPYIKETWLSGTEATKTVFKKYYSETSKEYQTFQMLVDGVYNINTHFVAGTNDLSTTEMAKFPADITDVNFGDRKRKIRNQWLVLSHGDCWVNNILFTYEYNKDKENLKLVPKSLKFIDLQAIREICLTTDLEYFFLMSTTGQLRKNHLDQFLAVYFNSFVESCKKLGVEPWTDFTLENLKLKFNKNFCFGASIACAFLALIILPKDYKMAMDKDGSGPQAGAPEDYFGTLFSKLAEMENEPLKERLISIVQEAMELGHGHDK